MDSDAGDGFAGDNWQHLAACAVPAFTASCPAADFIMIMGQCGGQCPSRLMLPFQQWVKTAAGPASSPQSRSTETNLYRMLTSAALSILPA